MGFEGAVPQEQADYAAHAPRPSWLATAVATSLCAVMERPFRSLRSTAAGRWRFLSIRCFALGNNVCPRSGRRIGGVPDPLVVHDVVRGIEREAQRRVVNRCLDPMGERDDSRPDRQVIVVLLVGWPAGTHLGRGFG